nr:Werner Syndrome-like exonuclease [Ipomoea batatas]
MIPPRLRRVRQCRHSFGLHQVHFHGNNLLVTVTKRAAEVDEWLNEILHNHSPVLHNLVVGLDIEWHPCFEAFLAHPRFTFVGVGVQDDAHKLLRDHGLAVRNVVDLRSLAEMVYGSEEFRRMGLKKMTWQILGRVMEKPREVTLSNWDSKNLTFRQIEYGSIDAFVSFELGFKLFAMAYTHVHSVVV